MFSPRRFVVLGPLLAVMLALGFAFSAAGQQATPQSQVVQNEDTRIFPASIHQGSCDQLGQTAYTLAPVGLPRGGQLVGVPALPAYESISTIPSVNLDTFSNGGYVVAISKSDVEIDTIVACGLVGGARYGDNLLFSIGPVGNLTFAGVVKMTQDQNGVTVTIHLIINPTNGATPVAAASPMTSPAAGAPATPIIGSSPVASTAQDQSQQGGQNQQTVTMTDGEFDPTVLTVPANTDVTIALVNQGTTVHSFNVDELNIHSGDIQPGGFGTVTIMTQPGDFQFYSAVNGQKEDGMNGNIQVR